MDRCFTNEAFIRTRNIREKESGKQLVAISIDSRIGTTPVETILGRRLCRQGLYEAVSSGML